jgi:hypothetical protein
MSQSTEAGAERSRRAVVDFLREAGGRCGGCGYELRGTESDRCPECGTVARLVIAARDGTGRGWWLTAVFGSAAGALVALVSLAQSVRQVWDFYATVDRRLVQVGALPQLRVTWSALVVMAVGLALMAGLTALSLAMRPRFAAWGFWQRAGAGLGLGAGPLVVVGVAWAFGRWGI